MAKFQWLNGNLGFYGYSQLGYYTMSGQSASGVTLTYDPSHGALDPTVMAASIRFTFSNYVSYIVETGPDAGQERVIGGTLTAITYLNGADATIMSVTSLSLALPIFLATLQRGDAFSAWAMVTGGSNTITGSVNASGPGQAGTGDVIDTGVGADIVNAQAGDDYMKDRGGADFYKGGTGYDTLAYDGWFFQPQSATRGIDADFALGTVTGPDGAIDKFSSIESMTGTFRADLIKGDGFGNKFSGMSGSDNLDGRSGFDFATYASDGAQGGSDGIKVNLATGTVRDGFGFLDRLISIEGIIGTAVADTFTDNASNNYFDGGAGSDVFHFSAGNDTGHGGAGADIFTFKGTDYGDDTIDDFSLTDGDHILFDAATGFGQLTLTNVKVGAVNAVNVQFGSGSVTIMNLTVAQLQPDDFGF